MNVKMNRSRMATREKIEAAFIEQLHSKRISDITVTNICEQAEINRSTFYENYADISALAAEISRRIEAKVSEIPHENGDYTWLFEYAAAHRDEIEAYFKLGIIPDAPDYQTAYFRSGIRSVVKSWFENGCCETAEFMNQILQKVIHSNPIEVFREYEQEECGR